MAKIQCYNCRGETPVVAPNYRCKHCNYPLNKYIQAQEDPSEENIIDKPELPKVDPVPVATPNSRKTLMNRCKIYAMYYND